MVIKTKFKLKSKDRIIFRESDIIFRIENESNKEREIEVNIN